MLRKAPWVAALLALAVVACSTTSSPPAPAGRDPSVPVAVPTVAVADAAAPSTVPLQRVTIGIPAPSLSFLPAKLADLLGHYREEGVEAEFVQVRGNSAIPSLLQGDLDFTTLLSAVGAHASQGGETRIVQFHGTGLQHVISARPEITTVQQLAGKRLAIESFGNLTAFEARKVVEHFTVPDVGLVAIGGDPERIAALESGAVDAAIAGIPANLIAERRGFPTVLRIATVVEAPSGGLASSQRLLREQPDRVTRALRAAVRTLPQIKNQRELVIEQIGAWMELSPADAARAYELVADTYSPNGVLTASQTTAYVELLHATAGVPADVSPTQLFDFTIARQVAAEVGLPAP